MTGLAGSLLAPSSAEASAAEAQERTVKTAFLNRFLGYTEFPGAALGEGSIINFGIIDGRMGFDASMDAADKHRVKLSSPLLTVAHLGSRGVR